MIRVEPIYGTGTGNLQPRSWEVYANGEDWRGAIRTTDREGWISVGRIGRRGGLRISPWLRRADRPDAEALLTRARADLVRDGELRDPNAERLRANEAKSGSFIVELDDGQSRRFSSLRRENRPGAMDWIDAELKAGPARHADVFRANIDGSRPTIYTSHFLPARPWDAWTKIEMGRPGIHPPMNVGTLPYLPIHSWSQGPGGITGNVPTAIRRAYSVKSHAMDLVDELLFFKKDVDPSDIADAWEVAYDAFIEAGLPLQQASAQANADYWRARAHVSSRRPAKPRRRRASRDDAESPSRPSRKTARDDKVKTVSVGKLFAWQPKVVNTIMDVDQGRLSYSSDAPLILTHLDSPRGAFMIVDGHHRAVEAVLNGQSKVAYVIDRNVPYIERTGGAYRSYVEGKVNVLDFVHSKRSR